MLAQLLDPSWMANLQGFQRMETDFPNYYTAAKLTVQHMPLRQFYDWVWFQRQIHYAGIDRQLGGYIPHTPLTVLPFLPLTAFAPQHAKQIWLVLGAIMLAASVLLLARVSRLPRLEVLVLALLAYSSLSLNFRLVNQWHSAKPKADLYHRYVWVRIVYPLWSRRYPMARKAGQLISRGPRQGLFAYRLAVIQRLELGSTTTEPFMAHSVNHKRT